MNRNKGNEAEEKACRYLKNLGFRIIERNFYSKFGEIDIIAIKDDVLHIIEVKSAINFEPIYNLTPRKLQKILKTLNFFMMKKRVDFPYQIDAIIIKNGDIEFLENVTV
ncbi:YraN family protein [Nitrosophilus labii]|uniref:YraN family protein n=1 Tax=Nitrosophilus labii TaxID=2706014 RepID=UPI001656B262|nr:YraN family protein [Nitrosophilus labii]